MTKTWWRCEVRTYNGYVHVCATAPEIAPANSFLTALGFCSPSGVRYVRTISYVMKLSPTCTRTLSQLQCLGNRSVPWTLTYGATPATVGVMPLYRAAIPPSVLYMDFRVDHMPGKWSGRAPSSANEADWIDRRVRTMSSGYVKKTDVMPAAPPQMRRVTDESSAPGEASNMFLTPSCQHARSEQASRLDVATIPSCKSCSCRIAQQNTGQCECSWFRCRA